MGLLTALETLNGLKGKGIIKDYAIGGGYAVNYYLEPSYTYDLDVLVLLGSDADYHALYQHFRELVSFRMKDKIHILSLLELADRKVLDETLRKFEDEKTPLRQRLGRVLANL